MKEQIKENAKSFLSSKGIDWNSGMASPIGKHNTKMPIGLEDILADFYISQIDNTRPSLSDEAIAFAEWLRTFEILTKENGQWVLDCQISSEKLYKQYRNHSPQHSHQTVEPDARLREAKVVEIAKKYFEHFLDENGERGCEKILAIPEYRLKDFAKEITALNASQKGEKK